MGKKTKKESDAPKVGGHIFFRPVEARALKGGKKIKPYCKVYLDKAKKFKTESLKAADPQWEAHNGLLPLKEGEPVETVKFAVWRDGLLSQVYIGEIKFSIKELLDGIPREDWHVLKNKKGTQERGELKLQVMYLKPGQDMDPKLREFPYPLQTMLRHKRMDVLRTMLSGEVAVTGVVDDDKDEVENEESAVNKKFDVNLKDDEGYTALHVACQEGAVEEVKILLEKGANAAEEGDDDGRTPLHSACTQTDKAAAKEIVAMLMKHKPNIDKADSKKTCAIHLAAQNDLGDVVRMLGDAGAKISPQDDEGETPLHLALKKSACEAVEALVELKADMDTENFEKKSVVDMAITSLSKDVDDETRVCFFAACNVCDPREFKLRKTYPNRLCVEGNPLKKQSPDNQQYAIVGPADGTDVQVLMWYDDPMVQGLGTPMEKTGFIAIKGVEGIHKEPTFLQDVVGYGQIEPLQFELKDSPVVIIPYTKDVDLTGKFRIICYSKEKIDIAELVDWKYKATQHGEWKGETAAGCIEHDDWRKNPKYWLEVPDDKSDISLSITLTQPTNVLDIVPFQCLPYKLYIGFYVYDEDLEILVEQCRKWKNARETCIFIKMDGTKKNRLVIVPTTYKPGEESAFTLSVRSDVKVVLRSEESRDQGKDDGKYEEI